jgi:alanyl-tRNA synthetase
VAAHEEDGEPAFLQAVARAFVPIGEGRVAVLTADGAKGASFLVVGAERFAGDVQSLGRELAAGLGGRGGGSGSIFQGRAESLANLAEATVRLRALVGEGPAS